MSAAFDRRRAQRAYHAACRDLGIDEDTRRDMQLSVTGVASTTAMGETEFAALQAHLKELGWTPKKTAGRNWRARSPKAHVRKVYAIWGALKKAGVWRESAHRSLDRFVQHVTGIGSAEWLDPEQANKVIEALKAIAQREGVKLQ